MEAVIRHYNNRGEEIQDIQEADYSMRNYIMEIDPVVSINGSEPNINILEEEEGLLSQILSAQDFGSGLTTESHLREMFKTIWEKQIIYGTSGKIYNPIIYNVYTKENRIDNIKKLKL